MTQAHDTDMTHIEFVRRSKWSRERSGLDENMHEHVPAQHARAKGPQRNRDLQSKSLDFPSPAPRKLQVRCIKASDLFLVAMIGRKIVAKACRGLAARAVAELVDGAVDGMIVGVGDFLALIAVVDHALDNRLAKAHNVVIVDDGAGGEQAVGKI